MSIRLKRLSGAMVRGLGATLLFAAPTAQAQINIGPPGGDPDDGQGTVCISANGDLTVSLLGDDCGDFVRDVISPLTIGPAGQAIVFDSTNGQSTFNNTATFNGAANFNGATSIAGPLTLGGSLTASGVTSTGGFTNTGGFSSNGTGTFGGNLTAGGFTTTGSATVGGQVNAGTVVATGNVRGGSLFTTGGATVQGFFNAQNGASLQGTVQVGTLQVFQGATFNGLRIQGVGTPTAGTDAANKNYVDGAVAGVQIGLTQATVDNLRQDQELADVRTVNTQQAAQIGAIQTVNTRQDQELTDVRTVNTQQAAQIATVQTVNARQDSELGDIRTVNTAQSAQLTTQGGQISAIQALDMAQGQQISALQTGQAALFDLANRARRDIGTANEGVAMALAMESPALPPGTTFALSGGVGYFNNRSAATTAITARIADRASFSAGIGVGFKSGEVGARSGFQIAW